MSTFQEYRFASSNNIIERLLEDQIWQLLYLAFCVDDHNAKRNKFLSVVVVLCKVFICHSCALQVSICCSLYFFGENKSFPDKIILKWLVFACLG